MKVIKGIGDYIVEFFIAARSDSSRDFSRTLAVKGGGNLPPPFGMFWIATADFGFAVGFIAMPLRSWLTPSVGVHTKSSMFRSLSHFQPYEFYVRFNFELSDYFGQLVIIILKQLLFHRSDFIGHFTIVLGNKLILQIVPVFAQSTATFKRCLLIKII